MTTQRRRALTRAVGVVIVVLTAMPALAQTPGDHVAFERLRLVDAPAIGPQAPTPAPKKKKAPRHFVWKDHPTLQVGIVRLAGRARVQVDSRTSDAPLNDDDDTLDIPRKRIGVDGEVGHYADFSVNRELGDRTDPWRDVYANYAQFDFAQLQAGKFKLPFGLDENTGATNLDFVYRSAAATLLSPGRDIGFMVHGRLLRRTLRYELGSFDHDGRNARPAIGTRVFGGRTLAGHVWTEPFRSSKSVLADFLVGVAWTSNTVGEGLSGIRGDTAFGQRFFASDFPVNGHRRRLGFETRWRPGPVSVQSEYIKVTDERLGEGVEDNDLSPLEATSWYVSSTWAVTGDRKSDGLDATRHPLFRGGAGAIEIAARVEQITFRSGSADETPSASPRADTILGNRERLLTVGVNWYFNQWMKVQMNFIKETLTDPAQGPLPDKPAFWSRVLRFQFTL